MKRNLSSSLGAFHPIFFMIMVYIISVALAFFVCTTIYNSMHQTTVLSDELPVKTEALTALK